MLVTDVQQRWIMSQLRIKRVEIVIAARLPQSSCEPLSIRLGIRRCDIHVSSTSDGNSGAGANPSAATCPAVTRLAIFAHKHSRLAQVPVCGVPSASNPVAPPVAAAEICFYLLEFPLDSTTQQRAIDRCNTLCLQTNTITKTSTLLPMFWYPAVSRCVSSRSSRLPDSTADLNRPHICGRLGSRRKYRSTVWQHKCYSTVFSPRSSRKLQVHITRVFIAVPIACEIHLLQNHPPCVLLRRLPPAVPHSLRASPRLQIFACPPGLRRSTGGKNGE